MSLPFTAAFEVLQERDSHFDKITREEYPSNLIGAQILLITLFAFLYGLIMGSYNSWQQSLSSGTKLFSLIFLTLLICFPSFYIVQLVLGSKVKIKQLAVMILSGFLMMTTIMLAFAPIILLFQLSGDNYNFLKFLHMGVFIFSGFFGMRAVLEALKNSFAETGVYPKIGLTIFRIWVVIFAFVGIQLAWNLRPFVGTKSMGFEIFRQDTRGNFYKTMATSLVHLIGLPGPAEIEKRKQEKKERMEKEKLEQAQQKETPPEEGKEEQTEEQKNDN